MKPSLHAAANGHLTLDLNESPDSFWRQLCQRMESIYGFRRTGSAVIGAGEQIHQSFELPGLALGAGWDDWSGHYLLSESDAGDTFLKKLFDDLSAR